MTKEDFKRYTGLPAERKQLINRLQRLEREAANVPTVKDKVQSSQKDFPYVQTHLTVDAPEPVRYTRLQNDIRRTRRRLDNVEQRLDELTEILSRINDARARQILTARYVDGVKLKNVAAQYDMTEANVLKIIKKTVASLTKFNF